MQRHVVDCAGGVCDCPVLTYAEWWDASTPEERREKLLAWGVRGSVSLGAQELALAA
ncbi:hypothetical protein AB0H73_27955 [Streptomyces olivoreticuli]